MCSLNHLLQFKFVCPTLMRSKKTSFSQEKKEKNIINKVTRESTGSLSRFEDVAIKFLDNKKDPMCCRSTKIWADRRFCLTLKK